MNATPSISDAELGAWLRLTLEPDLKPAQARALLAAVDGVLMSTTLIPEGEDLPLNDPEDILERYRHQLVAIIDGGACMLTPTTVIDLSGDAPEVLRHGAGDAAQLGLKGLD